MPDINDIAGLRADTPGTSKVIHLNNAGASLPPKPVSEALANYLAEEHLMGGYETMQARAEELREFYLLAAQLVNGHKRNMAFAGSATNAFNKALSSIPFKAGDVLLTTDDDYVSNHIAFLSLQKRMGIKVLRAAKAPEGGVDVQSMKTLIDRHHPKLVSVTHVPTNSGLVQPVEAIGELCQAKEIWYIVDACQSAGQLPLDVSKIKCDFLSATMRKFMRGPRGAGLLYASNRVLKEGLEPFFPDLHGAQWTDVEAYRLAPSAIRFEYFERPYELMVGSAAAMRYALNLGLANIERRVKALADLTRQKLSALPGVRVLDKGAELCGIVTAANPNWKKETLIGHLKKANINFSTQGRHNALIDFDEKGVEWALRVSPHYYNTEEEIEALVAALQDLA
ncbi:MAG: aminotransferase [Saprospirales bacterium]|nr:aminotransferase [Saprospirales bacterium]